jgi:hypothetical protein
MFKIAALFRLIFLLILMKSNSVLAIDLYKLQHECAEIGFKMHTKENGECVLQLVDKLKNRSSNLSMLSTRSDVEASSANGVQEVTGETKTPKISQVKTDATRITESPLLSALPNNINASLLLDSKKECKELGFKENTDKYIDCVIEITARNNNSAKNQTISGDGSQDDQTCQKYEFKPGTANYSDCRMKIDMAKQQAAQQQAQFQQQQQQYQAEMAEYNKRKERDAGLRLMQFGLGVLAGGGARNSSGGYIAPPVAPTISPSTQTYILPGGQHMNCTTTGSVTNCF